MNEILVVVLTAVIAVATTIYTFYSVQLYRSSQAAKEIARQTAFIQLWTRMVEYAYRHREAPTAESQLYEEFAESLMKFIVTELMSEVRTSRSPGAVTFRKEVQALVKRHEVSQKVAWLTPLADELRGSFKAP